MRGRTRQTTGLVEFWRGLGGVCLDVGSIPSKVALDTTAIMGEVMVPAGQMERLVGALVSKYELAFGPDPVLVSGFHFEYRRRKLSIALLRRGGRVV